MLPETQPIPGPSVEDALEEYYLKTGSHPPAWVTGETETILKPGEVVTLPAPGEASPPA